MLIINRARDALSQSELAPLAALADVIDFEARPGKSKALNHGLDLCRGEVIALTDDDVRPRPDWLRRIGAPLLDASRDERLVGVGGAVFPEFPEGAAMWYRRMVLAQRLHFIGPRHVPADVPGDYPFSRNPIGGEPIGCNLALRAEVFEKLRFAPNLGANRSP